MKVSEKEYTTNTIFNLRKKKASQHQNLIRFDGIIADVLNTGPLKPFALTSCCSETDILQHIQRNVDGDLRILGTITQYNQWVGYYFEINCRLFAA